MDVEETGQAVGPLSRALDHWRPRVLEYVAKLPLDDDGDLFLFKTPSPPPPSLFGFCSVNR